MPSLTSNAAMRSHLDSQIGILAELTRKSYDTARRLSELNLELARDLFDDYYDLTRQVVATGDPMQMSALMARQMQPFSERMRSYTQQLTGVLSGAQVDLTRATEHFMPDMGRAAQAFAANASMRAGPSLFAGPMSAMFSPQPGGNGAA